MAWETTFNVPVQARGRHLAVPATAPQETALLMGGAGTSRERVTARRSSITTRPTGKPSIEYSDHDGIFRRRMHREVSEKRHAETRIGRYTEEL